MKNESIRLCIISEVRIYVSSCEVPEFMSVN